MAWYPARCVQNLYNVIMRRTDTSEEGNVYVFNREKSPCGGAWECFKLTEVSPACNYLERMLCCRKGTRRSGELIF